jgi:hypothetical protein
MKRDPLDSGRYGVACFVKQSSNENGHEIVPDLGKRQVDSGNLFERTTG